MAQYSLLTELLGLPNVRVVNYRLLNTERLHIFIESTVEAGICPQCQQLSFSIHDRGELQTIRDLSIWNRRCWLRYRPRRFACAICQNTFVERVAWREPGLDYTTRYEEHLYEQVRREPVAPVAQDEGLSEDTVQGIFARGAKKHSFGVVTRR